MQHPKILGRDDVGERAGLDVADLDEAGLEGEDVRVRERERVRLPLPVDLPVRARAPAVPVHEEGEVGVVEQEVAVEALDVDGLDVLAARDEVERGVGLVQQRLALERLEAHDLEAARAADAQLRLEEVDRRRLARDVDLLMHEA